MSETPHEKATRLLEQHRVLLIESGPFPYRALVIGDNDLYQVTAGSVGVDCDCIARGECSHAIAAMVAFHEAAA